MPQQQSRYAVATQPMLVDGWQLQALTRPSRLFGANGMRIGPDGRIYVAQVSGSQISAVDVDTGEIEVISPMGGAIIAPDDLVFDAQGNLFVTEISEGRVSIREPNGNSHVLIGEMPVANPITIYQGKLIAGELRMGGRVMELNLDGGAPRIILDNVPMPNAFEVGPDGKLYMPIMATNEIWRVNLDGSGLETVARGLGTPDAVKFDAGGQIVSTQVGSGEVLRISPLNGERTVLARLTPGLDNVVFAKGRTFVSNMAGYITEILGDGTTRDLIPDGFNWPLGLAVDAGGTLYVADGGFSYLLRRGADRIMAGHLFGLGYPGYARGVAAAGSGEFIVTTAVGTVARFWPAEAKSEELARGLGQLYGVAVGPDVIAVAEQDTGRVLGIKPSHAIETLANDLCRPSGVAFDAAGSCYVSECAAGRVSRLSGGHAQTVLDGLQTPQGLAILGSRLYILDAGAKSVIEYDLNNKVRRVLASALPVGSPPGITPKPVGAIGAFCGPVGPFAGIAVGADGTLYVSADAEGSVLALIPQRLKQ